MCTTSGAERKNRLTRTWFLVEDFDDDVVRQLWFPLDATVTDMVAELSRIHIWVDQVVTVHDFDDIE